MKWSQYDYDLEELRVCERALREVTHPGRQVSAPQPISPPAGSGYREQLRLEIERLRARLELDD